MIPLALSLAFFKQLSLLVFLAIFVGSVAFALRMKSTRVQTESNLPLEDGNPANSERHHD